MQDLLVHLFIHDLMTFVSIVFVPACPVLSPYFFFNLSINDKVLMGVWTGYHLLSP